MEIVGQIIQVLEPRRGTSSRTGSEWICGQYVLETEDQYPKKVFFEVFGDDRIKQFNIQMGERLEVSIDIDAREYNGRWFNSVRAFRVNRNIQPVGAAAGYAAAEAPGAGGKPAPRHLFGCKETARAFLPNAKGGSCRRGRGEAGVARPVAMKGREKSTDELPPPLSLFYHQFFSVFSSPALSLSG